MIFSGVGDGCGGADGFVNGEDVDEAITDDGMETVCVLWGCGIIGRQ